MYPYKHWLHPARVAASGLLRALDLGNVSPSLSMGRDNDLGTTPWAKRLLLIDLARPMSQPRPLTLPPSACLSPLFQTHQSPLFSARHV